MFSLNLLGIKMLRVKYVFVPYFSLNFGITQFQNFEPI